MQLLGKLAGAPTPNGGPPDQVGGMPGTHGRSDRAPLVIEPDTEGDQGKRCTARDDKSATDQMDTSLRFLGEITPALCVWSTASIHSAMARREEYRQYLRSPEWRQNREFALARTSGFCQFCGDIAVHVHHVRYPKRFGDEHPHSLVPVCERCHNSVHGVHAIKALSNVVQMTEMSPNGRPLKYLLSGARVYASVKSWANALQIPQSMAVWFETGLSRTATLKKDMAGGDLEMSYLNVTVYRWHVVAEQLRAFDREWYKSDGYTRRPFEEKKELERFHGNYDRLVSWGYDLQERALASALNGTTAPSAAVMQESLVAAIRDAVAPRLQGQDNRLHEHDVVIAEIKEAVPMLRDQDEFITVKQAISEKALDPTSMPLYPNSKETLSGLAGQMLATRGVAKGGSVIARLDGQSASVAVNTYRRRDIYGVLDEVSRNRQGGLPL